MRVLELGARFTPFVSAGRRGVSYPVQRPDGSITVDSRLADGAVTRVQCGAYSTLTVGLTAATNPLLHFFATLPVTGAAPDTAARSDRQFAGAAVSYSKLQEHNGMTYDLMYSQYDSERTHDNGNDQPGDQSDDDRTSAPRRLRRWRLQLGRWVLRQVSC